MVDVVWGFLKKWWPSVATALLAVMATIFIICWEGGDPVSEIAQQRSEIYRNYGLLIAAPLIIFLTVWRGQIASQQAESAFRQTETSERGLSDGRFQKGADMLGNRDIVTRMGGIYALKHLAKDHSDGYYRDQIIKLLTTFVRYPVPDDKLERRIKKERANFKVTGRDFREDVSESVHIICDLNRDRIATNSKLDLSNSDLENMYFNGLDFSGVSFWSAHLKEVELIDCNLTNARISHSDCTDSNFSSAILTGASLDGSDISGANFMGTKGLSQKQLNQACHAPDCEPTLPEGLSMDHEAAVARWKELYRDE